MIDWDIRPGKGPITEYTCPVCGHVWRQHRWREDTDLNGNPCYSDDVTCPKCSLADYHPPREEGLKLRDGHWNRLFPAEKGITCGYSMPIEGKPGRAVDGKENEQ